MRVPTSPGTASARWATLLLATLLLAAVWMSANVARADEFVGTERITTWSWNYVMETQTLSLRVCGRFRPGERDQCAVAKLKDAKGGRTVDRAMEMLRLPRDVVGIRMRPGTGAEFELTGLTHELLSAPGIGEKAAKGKEVQLSGESLTRVEWIQSLTNRNVGVRVCGKLANPEIVGCAEYEAKTIAGVRRLGLLFLRGPVDQLEFRLGWDGATRKFTGLMEITSPSN